jgi:hypothetical protein
MHRTGDAAQRDARMRALAAPWLVAFGQADGAILEEEPVRYFLFFLPTA